MSQRYQMNILNVKQHKKSYRLKDKGFSPDAKVLALIDLVVVDSDP